MHFVLTCITCFNKILPVFSRTKDRHRDMCRLFSSTFVLATLRRCLIFLFFFLSNFNSVFLEPIVEIRASINISRPSWYKGTPIPMICIMKQSDYVKDLLSVSKKLLD